MSETTLPAGDPDVAVAARKPKSPIRGAVEWVVIVALALLAAFVIQLVFVKAFYIPSQSMEPTLRINDRVLVNKLSYKLHDINRGDVVVFARPPNTGGALEIKDLIKRVVALGGETVESRDGAVYIDDRKLNEPYLTAGTQTTGLQRIVVPEGHVFVMGDNRGDSKDSRVFGPIPEGGVVGRAFVRIWPLSHLGLL